MFYCKEIIICFLFLLKKITCSVTDDSSYFHNIERNKNIKEDIDKMANNFIAHRENLLNFKNCIEYFVYEMFREPIYLIYLKERMKSILNSKEEILKKGFNLDELKLHFREDIDHTKQYQIYEYRFYKRFLTSYNGTKTFFNQIDIIDKFHRKCIEESKPFIIKYSLVKFYYKLEWNNYLEEIRNNFDEFIKNDANASLIKEIKEYFARFYTNGGDFYDIWSKCNDELKYRWIFGYECVNLKKKEIKFDEALICNKIREIKEMYDYINNYYLNFTIKNYYLKTNSLETNQKYTEMMEFIYNTELILQKCKLLCQFIKENKSCITKTYYNKDNIIEKTVSEKNINEYIKKIEYFSNKIKNNYPLKFTVNSIWNYLSIMFGINETILDDF
ncbi:hypothetical protein H311_03176, partial [Anncaliia algerae PRA109]